MEEEIGPPRTRSIILGLLAFLIVLILVIVSYNVIVYSRDEDSGPAMTLTSFRDGSHEPLVNASYAGSTVYIEVPSDASIDKASLTLSGAIQPPEISIEVGEAPISITSADFNRDGYPDLASANYNEDTVSLRFNQLGESLRRGGNYPVGMGVMKVLSPDLDSDGDPDLIALSTDVPKLTALLNDGEGLMMDGTQSFDTDPVPSDVMTMDVEGDGDIDVVVSSTSTDDLCFFENDGIGNLAERMRITTGKNPLRMVPADMDKDGMTDIVVYLSQGNGTMKNTETWKDVKWLSTVIIVRSIGAWLFDIEDLEYRVKRGVYAIDSSDLDRDGYPDLAMANLGNHAISVLYSSGTGGFRKGTITGLDSVEFPALDPIDITLNDIDRDGDIDIITLSKSGDSACVYYNAGNGSFGGYEHYYVGLSPAEMTLTDFDLDGDLDLATADWRSRDAEKGGNGTISVTMNFRNGIFGSYKQFVTGNSPRGIYSLDIDGDGYPEVATANYFSSTVSVLKNDGAGNLGQRQNYFIGLEPYMVVLADFDRDGYVDAASADEANFRIILLESDRNGGFIRKEPIYIDIHAYPFSLRSTDVDLDGDLDLYTSNYAQRSVTILFNDGTGDFETIFSEYTIVDLGDRMPYDSYISDLNGDGIKDLVTVNTGDALNPTNTVSVFIGKSPNEYIESATYKVGSEPLSVCVRDYDNDGDLDLATADRSSDTVTVLLNDGAGRFKLMGTYEVGDRPGFVESIDFDNDGWTDLAVTNTESNDLCLLRNDRGDGFHMFNKMLIGSYPFMITVMDLNGDGREEISLTSVNTARIVVQGCYYYPSDVRIDVGADGDYEYEGTGLLTSPQEIDIASAISEYLDEHGGDGPVSVPVQVSCGGEGIVKLSDLVVIHR
jgi:hypothetical protein